MKVGTIHCFCTSRCMTKRGIAESQHAYIYRARVAAYEREQFCETNLEYSPTTP